MSGSTKNLIPAINNNKPTLQAGAIVNHFYNWTQLTSDNWVLECVKGYKIPFLFEPIQFRVPHPFSLTQEEREFVSAEINRLLNKGVLRQVAPVEGQWLSNIFLRPKSNGKFRMILDLTMLNKLIEYRHFKMFNLNTALDLLSMNCWMASVDLTDAYYAVPIAAEHKKLLRFNWGGRLFEYQVLPNGLSPGPRLFTKLLKPIYGEMGELGHICFPYIDDSFIMGNSRQECEDTVNTLTHMFETLGFTLNREKSQLVPDTKLVFLGFEINSELMIVSLTDDKKEKLRGLTAEILNRKFTKIREVAGLIGLMIAYTPGVEYGGAHCKALERNKIKALKRAKGDFGDMMWLSQDARDDIMWWISNMNNPRIIRRAQPDVELFTDASESGWGAHTQEHQTGGRWLQVETDHINVLELKAILFGLKSLCRISNSHIRVRTDSTTALAYVKNMGGTRSGKCLSVSTDIWNWAQQNNNWLTITHIPGVENVLADLRSRKFSDHLEWSLNPEIFEDMCETFGYPEVDMFASRSNFKLGKYVSWEPDPDSWRTDAFTFAWTDMYVYCFPPFRILPRVIRKIQADRANALVVAPLWTGQPWFPLLRKHATAYKDYPRSPANLAGQGRLQQDTDAGLIKATKLTAYLFWHTH